MKNTQNYYSLYILCFVLFLSTGGCRRTENNPTPTHTNVKFLGHKGAGSNNYEDKYMEMTPNSFSEALQVVNGIHLMDGIEIDAQMSLDGTIWLYHDSCIDQNCYSGQITPGIYEMHDVDIESRQLCATIAGGVSLSTYIYKLSDLITLWNNTSGGFYMDWEIKQADLNQHGIIAAWGSMHNYLARMAYEFDTLLMAAHNPTNQIIIEVDDTTFCHIIKNQYPGVHFDLFRYGFTSLIDYTDSALALGYNGISQDFAYSYVTASGVAYAQSKGLTVTLWTPYTQADLTTCFNMNPNFIQSDNTNAKSDLNVD